MITLTNPNTTLYFLAYGAAFAVMLLFFLWEGRRRKYPLLPLLLIFLSGLFFLLAGSRLGTYDLENWRQLVTGNAVPAGRAQTSLTAVLGGMTGIVLAKRLLGFRHPVADCFAFALPAAMIFIRTSCLLAGCCHGLPTDVRWSIHYTAAFPVFQNQLGEGLIGPEAVYSLGVHPVPIYFMVLAVITLILLYRFRNSWRASGSLFLFSLLLLSSGRFLIEFFRDPVTNHQLGELFLGLKSLQWVLLVFTLGIGAVLFLREKRVVAQSPPREINKASLPRLLILFFTLAFLSGTLLEWMNWEAKLILGSSLYIIALILGIRIFREITVPAYRQITLGLLAIALLCIAQMAPEEEEPAQEKSKPTFLHTFTAGFLSGEIPPVGYSTTETGCSGNQYSYYNETGPRFSSLGIQYEMNKLLPDERDFRLGLGYQSTWHDYRRDELSSRERIDNLWLYTGWGWEMASITIGLNAGNFNQAGGEPIKATVLPVGRLRLGPTHKVFFEAGIGDDFPYGVYGTYYHGALGLNMDLFRKPGPHDVDFTLKIGAANIGEETAVYLSPEFQFKRFLLRPTARFAGEYSNFGITAGVQMGEMPDN